MGLRQQCKINLLFVLFSLPLPTAGLTMSTGNEFGTLILLRHGESEWNKSNRFSGWLDVGLTAHGEAQAAAAGDALRAHGYTRVDECHTSALCRASDTLALCLQAAGLDGHDGRPAPPVHARWQLNERHYGALTGLDKADAQAALGAQALAKYRRDFDTPPPPMRPAHPLFGAVYPDAKYGAWSGAEVAALPVGESLAACHARVQAYVAAHLHPPLQQGRTVVVAAHNNVLRTLMVHLDGADPRGPHGSADIPKAVPIVYQLDRTTLKPRPQASLSSLGGFTGMQLCQELPPSATAASSQPRAGRRAGAYPTVAVDEVLTLAAVRAEARKLGLADADVPLLATSAQRPTAGAAQAADPTAATAGSSPPPHQPAAAESHFAPWLRAAEPLAFAAFPSQPALQGAFSAAPGAEHVSAAYRP